MTPLAVWEDACLAISLLSLDPAGLGGIAVRAQAGPVRDRLVGLAPGPARRLPASVSDEALFGGIDLAATLNEGRTIRSKGLLAGLDGGTLISPMAERLSLPAAARLAHRLDEGAGFGLLALDEGADADERLPSALLDRLAFHVDLTGLSHRDAAALPPRPAALGPDSPVSMGDDLLEVLCHTAVALGVESLRAVLLAVRAARAAARLAGRSQVSEADAALAARLVLAPRATRLPPAEADGSPPDQPPEADGASQAVPDSGDARSADSLAEASDIVLAAARAAIPAGLLEKPHGKQQRSSGREAGFAGEKRKGTLHGRPAGVRAGRPGPGMHLNVVETLRAAAPWQRLRAPHQQSGLPLHIRREDFRIVRTEQRARSTTVFLVDASGSSALNRLAEAKGAVELLLGECYRRRDEVAVIAFRGRAAQLLLPPTRSLVRAKRSLAKLPGGGGTPLAAAIDAGCALALTIRRGGATPTVVLLTDGRANVTRSGEAGRAQAAQESLQSARRLREAGVDSMLLDTSPRPAAAAEALAGAMGARYVPLPYADAARLSRAIRAGL